MLARWALAKASYGFLNIFGNFKMSVKPYRVPDHAWNMGIWLLLYCSSFWYSGSCVYELVWCSNDYKTNSEIGWSLLHKVTRNSSQRCYSFLQCWLSLVSESWYDPSALSFATYHRYSSEKSEFGLYWVPKYFILYFTLDCENL